MRAAQNEGIRMNNIVTFEQRVRERISGTIADMVPPEELEQLVKSQVERFQRSELPDLILKTIRERYMAALRDELDKPEYKPQWTDGGGQVAGMAIQKIITENAGQMLASLVGSMVQQTMYQMQSNLPRY
jgi:hypothetical protein